MSSFQKMINKNVQQQKKKQFLNYVLKLYLETKKKQIWSFATIPYEEKKLHRI